MKKYLITGVLFCLSLSIVYAQDAIPFDESAGIVTCTDLRTNLSFGSVDAKTNNEVTDLQFFLQENGYLTVEPTGYFGVATKNAVKLFQRASGIIPNGQVGPLTRAKITKITCTDENNQSEDASPDTSLLQVMLPQTNGVFEIGKTYTITWTGASPTVSSYVVTLSSPSYQTFAPINLGTAYTSAKQFTFTIPTGIPTSSDYRIYFTSYSQSAQSSSFIITGANVVSTSTSTVPSSNIGIDLFTASPATISYGKITTLLWKTTKPSTCIITDEFGNNYGLQSVDTGFLVITPKTTTKYKLECSAGSVHNSSNKITAYYTVNVTSSNSEREKVSVVSSFNASHVRYGGVAYYSHTATAASKCQVTRNNQTKEVQGKNYSEQFTSVTQPVTITVVCYSDDGKTSATSTATISVDAPVVVVPPKVLSFTVSATRITAGDPVTLSWTTDGTENVCNLMQDNGNSEQTSGGKKTAVYYPTVNTTYTLSCSKPDYEKNTIVKSDLQNITVKVGSDAVKVTSTFSPASVTSGGSSVFSFSSVNATKCQVTSYSSDNDIQSEQGVSFSKTYSNIFHNKEIRTVCYNKDGIASETSIAKLKVVYPVTISPTQ